MLTSAWFFFRKPAPGQSNIAEKFAFIRSALPSLAEGARTMLAFGERHPDVYRMVTYERLRQTPELELAALFRFLGLSDRQETVLHCLDRTSFDRATGGRAAGVARDGEFLRKGVVGDWRSTLTPEMNDLILRDLGWTFPAFRLEPITASKQKKAPDVPEPSSLLTAVWAEATSQPRRVAPAVVIQVAAPCGITQ